ncbi:MAG: 50S ribosomal protein L31e, partial [Halobacteriota archaeon]
MSASDFEERIITVPLRDASNAPRGERADHAMSLIRRHLARHFSVDPDEVRLDPSINEAVWARGRRKPPRRLRIRAARFSEAGVDVVDCALSSMAGL